MQQYQSRLKLLSPINQLNEKRQMTADLEEKLKLWMEQQLTRRKHELELLAGRLDALSPAKKLSQGYAYVADEAGHSVRDVEKLKQGDILQIHMSNGKVQAQVCEIEPSNIVPQS